MTRTHQSHDPAKAVQPRLLIAAHPTGEARFQADQEVASQLIGSNGCSRRLKTPTAVPADVFFAAVFFAWAVARPAAELFGARLLLPAA